MSHSYREGVTKAARQRDVLRVGETRLQGQLALGRGDQVGVGEAELHREPVLCSYHPSYKIVSWLVPTLAARVAPHLGGVVEAVVRVPAPGPGGGVLDRASNEGS